MKIPHMPDETEVVSAGDEDADSEDELDAAQYGEALPSDDDPLDSDEMAFLAS